MGAITTGIGLISGIDTASLINSLIALESRGKVALQQRISQLQSQRTALLDINARLLNLKNSSSAFRASNIFQSALAISSNKDVLTATATTAAQPGTFHFTVKQLVAHSQKLSRGFADTATPIGLTNLSFQFGRGTLHRDRPLSELNGGAGVANGRITITDKTGAQATIDLTDTTTLGEVIDRINAAASVAVTASLDGDRIVVNDTSGGVGSLTIANAAGFTTATELGIAGSSAGGTITGSDINFIAAATSLGSLNDGTGVLVRNNVADFRITARNGQVFDIDLGRIDLPITADTLLSDLNNGDGVAISSDHDNPDIRFVDRDGNEHNVNLTGITTVGQLISRVNVETGGAISLAIGGNGKRLAVTDNTGGDGPLKILGAGINGTKTALDLGILNESGLNESTFNGLNIPSAIDSPAVATIGQVIERINQQTNGTVVASIAADGASITLTDTTGETASNLIVRATAANPYAASSLGIETDEAGLAGNTIDGRRLIADLGSVLVRNLNGGSGLSGASAFDITDRAGNSVTITGLDAFHSLSQIIVAINDQAAAEGVQITASLNTSGTGLLITDASGGSAGNLIITGDAAAALGIEADIDATTVRGSNLHLQYVSAATPLSELNYGRGIGHGSFRITDGFGRTAVININNNQKSLYDVIQVINAQAGGNNGLAIRARINDTGDGLIIEEDLADVQEGQTPFVPLKVQSVSGTAAKDLNILGSASTIEGGFIDGSYERKLTFGAGDTLQQIVNKINAAGIPLTASILNTGNGATPHRLNFTSSIGGAMGELIIDSGDFDLGLTTLSKGQDAKVFFGSPGSEGGFLVTSQTNTVTNVLPGVTLNLHAVSESSVSVAVQRDTDKIVSAAKHFVTTFNDAIGRINDYDHFDLDTEQRGVLLGNPTTARLRDAMHRAVRQRVEGVDTQFQFLREVGIRIGAKGELTFDEVKFREAYESDPHAVEKLFTAWEVAQGSSDEIAPGVTIQNNSATPISRGFGEIFRQLTESFTDTISGTVTRAERNFQSMIDLARRRIEAMEVRLESRRKHLERQFMAMETALAQLQGQGGAIGGLSNNIALMNNMFGQR